MQTNKLGKQNLTLESVRLYHSCEFFAASTNYQMEKKEDKRKSEAE